MRVFGENPYENARVLSRMCFVRESQKYPGEANAKTALASARMFFPNWDQALADELVDDFQLPMKTIVKKLSRGQLSNLIERVLVIDGGRILMDQSVEDTRDQATNIVGEATLVEGFIRGREVLHREALGRVASVTFLGQLSPAEKQEVREAGLDLAPVPLQQLIVRMTQRGTGSASASGDLNDLTTETEGALR